MKGKGIILGDNGPLVLPVYDSNGLITSGVVIGDVTRQNQMLLLLTKKGELKMNPAVGIGIHRMLNDNDLLFWHTETKKQLEADGQVVRNISFKNHQNLIIDASYSS